MATSRKFAWVMLGVSVALVVVQFLVLFHQPANFGTDPWRTAANFIPFGFFFCALWLLFSPRGRALTGAVMPARDSPTGSRSAAGSKRTLIALSKGFCVTGGVVIVGLIIAAVLFRGDGIDVWAEYFPYAIVGLTTLFAVIFYLRSR